MNFEISSENDVTVVDVSGQLIVGNRHQLKDAVLKQVEGGARKVLVNFADTAYIDSSGLGVLVSLSKKVREKGGELRLSSLNEGQRVSFELVSGRDGKTAAENLSIVN